MTDVLARLGRALGDRYAIERELGQGGMATVYLARDLRHDRAVALKVLRPELASILGAERFLAEIKTTAHLQHPHILALHDSGEAGGLVFYVMPYVEGESLRDRLLREKQLPVEEAVRIASEVASALDYAHRHQVVHRDIKPENVLLHEGQALVADFGIALAVSRTEGGTRLTETGLSLGTPAYMAPEQAMGEREITPRADLYALGCVLYEMLTGEPPFTGPTAQAIVARVMTEAPRSLTLQRHTIPPHVEAAVGKALEKLPADRFSTAGDFAAALANPAFGSVATPATAGPKGAWSGAVSRPWTRVAPWGLVALLAGLAAWGWLRARPSRPHPVARFILSLPSGAVLSGGVGSTIAMSPDGARIAYVGRDDEGHSQLFLRSLDRLDPVPLPGTAGGTQPFFSPDGLWLAFLSGSKLMKVPLTGGAPLSVCATDSGFNGATWSAGDVIVYGSSRGLRQVPAAGGDPAVLTTSDRTQEASHHWPEFLPDGKTVLFTVRGGDGVDRLAAVTLASGAVKRFAQTGSNPHFVAPGFVLLAYVDGRVVAVPFDERRVAVTGSAIPVAEGVMVGFGGAAKLGASRDGALAYFEGTPSARSLVLVDRHGVAQRLTTDLRAYASPRFSPDGRKIAVAIVEPDGSDLSSDIWIRDMAQKTLTRLTFDRSAFAPVWTPDGKRVTYSRGAIDVDMAWIKADGSAPAESLFAGGGPQAPAAWTRDGRTLVFISSNDLMYLTLDSAGSATRHVYLQSPPALRQPALSPDGRWIAYSSNESSRFEIYVRSFPEPGGKVQVSLEGGMEPMWSRDGRELFYRRRDTMMVAEVRTGQTFTVLKRAELFHGRFQSSPVLTQYDVGPDGRHLLMSQGPVSQTDIVVVLHWFDRLRARPLTSAPAKPPASQ